MQSLDPITVVAYIIALVVYFIIFYYLIAAGVKSGVHASDYWNQQYLKINNRLLCIMLVNQGMKAAELKAIVNSSEDQFWTYLMEKDGSIKTAR